MRDGFNPQDGTFQVIAVNIDNKVREFAADLKSSHVLNADDGNALAELVDVDEEQIYLAYGPGIEAKVVSELEMSEEFVKLGDAWFVKALMADVSVGHLHLAEAVLEMNEGGPLPTQDILPHLDMDPSAASEVKIFSLKN